MRFPYLAALVLLVACSKKQESTQPVVQDITESVYASGTVKSRDQYQVFASANGLIEKILVREGDTIKRGQPIITIVNTAAKLSEANARLATENASLSSNTDKLNELRSGINLARAKVQNDSTMLQRQRALWAQQIGTRNDVDMRELQFRNSVTALEAAISRYNDAVKQLRFAERQSQNNLRISSSMSADYTVRSETNGRLYKLLKEKGEMVNMQTPVAIIGKADEFILELQVDEYDIARIRLGQELIVRMDSYKDSVFNAVITRIDPIMNDRTRSFLVEAVFSRQPPALYPNLTAEANIVIQTKKKAVTIPRAYLVDETYVLVNDDKKKKVVTGLKDYEIVEIISGLAKDETIYKPAN